jgi:hypothetical protein
MLQPTMSIAADLDGAFHLYCLYYQLLRSAINDSFWPLTAAAVGDCRGSYGGKADTNAASERGSF